MQVAARHDRGFATNEEHEYRRWQLVVNHVFHDLSDTTAVFADLWQHFAATSHWQLYDDVEPIWEELQAKSTKLAIGSNFDRRLQSICEHLSTLRTCQQVFWSAQIGVRKPGRGFFDHIARRLECEAENLLMVGDDVANDYHGAISAGWHARWIDRGATMTQLPRSHRLESLTELLSLLAD